MQLRKHAWQEEMLLISCEYILLSHRYSLWNYKDETKFQSKRSKFRVFIKRILQWYSTRYPKSFTFPYWRITLAEFVEASFGSKIHEKSNKISETFHPRLWLNDAINLPTAELQRILITGGSWPKRGSNPTGIRHGKRESRETGFDGRSERR